MKQLAFLLTLIAAGQVAFADTCPVVLKLLGEVSQKRELSLKAQVGCIEITNQAEFQRHIERSQRRFIQSSKQINFDEQTSKMLGLVPEDFDYSHCLGAVATQRFEAFYDPAQKSFIVPSFKHTQRAILVHEAVHALQDQHFGLLRLEKLAQNSTDQALAITALLEGDASTVQEELRGADVIEVEGEVNTNQHCELPETLKYQYEFPEFFGKLFVKALRAQGGWNLVNTAFERIPATTRDILYTKEFLRSGPHTVPVAQKQTQDSWGEYSIRTLLRAYLPISEAQLAAKGWNKDALTLSVGRNTKLHWKTYWDSENDAQEFYVAFAKILESRFHLPLKTNTQTYDLTVNHRYRIAVHQAKGEVQISIRAPS